MQRFISSVLSCVLKQLIINILKQNKTNPEILCHYSTLTGKAKSQEAPGLQGNNLTHYQVISQEASYQLG